MKMAIIFDEEKRTFSLHTQHTTYQMKIDKFGVLLHLYYGRKTEGCLDYLLTFADRGFSGNLYDAGQDRTYSYDALPQEFPYLGSGDYRSPAFVVKDNNGALDCDLRFDSYFISKGKYGLKGLPAVYADQDQAETLEVVLKDTRLGAKVSLLYGVLPKYDIITRAVAVKNEGGASFDIDKIASASLDFLTGSYDLISFYGRHGMERNYQRNKVSHGVQLIGSRRGASSHQYNPLMILTNPQTTETQGSAWAMEFVYSGGFRGMVGKDQYNQTRWQMGLMAEQFSYPLEPGAVFYAPEVMMTYSSEGLSRLSNNLQSCIRSHVCRGRYKDQIRPVLLNSWEACYFQFTGEKLLKLARDAKDLGMDMFVLDDGWFGKRNDDNSGLGDWYVNEDKLGGKLKNLVDQIHDMGLLFGIWVEPEMVSEDSDLYRAHPDWALTVPGRKPIRSRNQLVLDFSRKEVVDTIFDQICQVLDQVRIDYLKWDYNRSISDVYSQNAKDQGTVLYDYILGLYDFLERLTARYPDLLIEGCSGGGGRFDAGMLYYTPQIWCSDNTDAVDRLRIQYGTSFGYPISAMGAHVSAVPNEQSGRVTPLGTRGTVAMSGTFGYELDPGKLSDKEKAEIRRQVAVRKQYARLIFSGKYYRLSSPFTDPVGAWEFISEDGNELLVNAVTLENHCNMPATYVRFSGLPKDAIYKETETGRLYPSNALQQIGIPVPFGMGEYRAFQWHFDRVR